MVKFNRRALKQLRSKRGWDQGEAAEAIGISRQSLSYIERGAVKPSADTLAKMAMAFGVSVDQFYLTSPARGKAEAR